MFKLRELSNIGQSIWYDYIRRSFITSGELQALIYKGLNGVTSNPTIFEKTIIGSSDYDKDLKRLIEEGCKVDEIYERMAMKDISLAADLFLPLYKSTRGLNGYVSLEVNPNLAHDTKGTVSEAQRLFRALNRPNVMIKVPATSEGLPAITELIGDGINVNVTLIFSISNYMEVAMAYLEGLEKLNANGGDLRKVTSVASFFVSRIDTKIDQILNAKGNVELQGKIAIANSKAAYEIFREIFSGSRWNKLVSSGARVQRLLWASTGTKNPLYSDIMYIDNLIAPDTVNTIPPSTLKAFEDHGKVAITIMEKQDEAKTQLVQLEKLGIDLNEVTKKLQKEGVSAFAKSFETLKAGIKEKQDILLAGKRSLIVSLGGYEEAIDKAIFAIKTEEIMRRIWDHDYTIWNPDPAEITNRLGWLHSPDVMMETLPEVYSFVDEIRCEGFTHALLLGMGGSSLAPEVFRDIFGVKEGYIDLSVLDTTDPGAVLGQTKLLNPEKTLYIVSTKSGGTVETISLMKYFYNQVLEALGKDKVKNHFIAITDPDSGLETMAEELNFRKIFLNDPNIGGRYSALSYFGLVPAVLIGVDIEKILNSAAIMALNSEGCNCPVRGNNTAAWLGAVMGGMADSGKDKLTLIFSPPIAHFGAWVEQLIAESTGKEGRGILPVNGEIILSPDAYANDRLFVYIRLNGDSTHDVKVKALKDAGHQIVQINLRNLYDLGGEFFRWEMATAIAGWRINVNPFDQPNVESAKVLAMQMVTTYQKQGKLPEPEPSLNAGEISVYTDVTAQTPDEALKIFLEQGSNGMDERVGRSYIALQAYVTPSSETHAALQSLRIKIQKSLRMATTLGYGPRFLHSTGQLHKGDAGRGLFIQFYADMPEDVAIPDKAGEKDSSISFGVLKKAQLFGDREALLKGGRYVISFDLGHDAIDGLTQFTNGLA